MLAGIGGTSIVVAVACSAFDDAPTASAPATDAGGEDAPLVDAPSFDAAPDAVVLPPRESIATIAAGAYHACAIREGIVYCWGSAEYFAIGQGPASDCAGITCQPTARRIAGLEGETVVEITVGTHATCARTADREVYCWGSNGDGQLGVGINVVPFATATPVKIPLPAAYGVALGANFGCARVADDGGTTPLWCWGKDLHGTLGRGVLPPEDGAPAVRRQPPGPIAWDASIDDVRLASLYELACARSGEEIRCWGLNGGGVLGHKTMFGGDKPCREFDGNFCNATPSVVTGAFRSLEAVGAYFACARDPNTFKCWGVNYTGELAQGTLDGVEHPTPASANALPDAVAIVALRARSGHGCALDAAGDVWCWGSSAAGEIGVPPAEAGAPCTPLPCRLSVEKVLGLPPIAEIAPGHLFTIARAVDGSLWAWGTNAFGQLGHTPGGADDVDCPAVTNYVAAGKCNAVPKPVLLP